MFWRFYIGVTLWGLNPNSDRTFEVWSLLLKIFVLNLGYNGSEHMAFNRNYKKIFFCPLYFKVHKKICFVKNVYSIEVLEAPIKRKVFSPNTRNFELFFYNRLEFFLRLHFWRRIFVILDLKVLKFFKFSFFRWLRFRSDVFLSLYSFLRG